MIDLDQLEKDFLAAKESGDTDALLTHFYVLLGSYAVVHTRWAILLQVIGTRDWQRVVHVMKMGLAMEFGQIELMRRIVKR